MEPTYCNECSRFTDWYEEEDCEGNKIYICPNCFNLVYEGESE